MNEKPIASTMLGPSTTDERLLTVREVAYLLNISRTMVYTLIRSGDLPTIHIGYRIRVRSADLDAFLSRHRKPARVGPSKEASPGS